MPELESRADNEQRLAAAILLVFRDFERQAIASGGQINYRELKVALQRAIEEELAAAYTEAALAMWILLGMPSRTSLERLDMDAKRWSANYAAALSDAIAASTMKQIDQAIDRVNQEFRQRHKDGAVPLPNEITASFAAALLLIFGSQRAAAIAATEITRTVSRGERDARQLFNDQTGQTVVPIWNTERDARVCKICNPLHGKQERFWKERFPLGPPAHPNCRCWLEYEVMKAVA